MPLPGEMGRRHQQLHARSDVLQPDPKKPAQRLFDLDLFGAVFDHLKKVSPPINVSLPRPPLKGVIDPGMTVERLVQHLPRLLTKLLHGEDVGIHGFQKTPESRFAIWPPVCSPQVVCAQQKPTSFHRSARLSRMM